MKIIELKKGTLTNALLPKSIKEKDLADSKSKLLPGEWCLFQDQKAMYIGFGNNNTTRGFVGYVLSESKAQELDISSYIASKIYKAQDFRKYVYNDSGCRLFFGQADGLPGLIVDKYNNMIIVQINTAGIDNFRDTVQEIYKTTNPRHRVVIFDNQKQRLTEQLPVYPVSFNENDICEIIENGISYSAPLSQLQKNGFYYDHRENRTKLVNLIKKLGYAENSLKCLDLFCYLGAWGLNLNKEFEKFSTTFVDQSAIVNQVGPILVKNNINSEYKIYQQDVFSFLDGSECSENSFDLIVLDPPAFSKKVNDKSKAKLGYSKLFKKVLKLIRKNGIIVFASCTQGISIDELDGIAIEAARISGVQLSLLDVGVQPADHPSMGLNSEGFYLKALYYFVRDK